jgi:hypothetical protein
MIRRFNYTNRQRIPRENVRLKLIENGEGPLSIKGEINLNFDTPLNPEALVFVEAYKDSVAMRFYWGTVGNPSCPADTMLTDLPRGLNPLFRIRVVDPTDEKRLLALADRIRLLTSDEMKSGSRSILPVETVDLGQRVWNLRIHSNTFFLQLNSAIREPRDITVLAREADFIALVYPAVIRQILEHLLLGPEKDFVEENHEWLLYGGQISGEAPPVRSESDEDDESFDESIVAWIDKVVGGFCESRNAKDTFVQFRKTEGESHA